MLGFFERGKNIDLSVIFISSVTGELLDPINPTVEISHYVGTSEIIDLPEVALTKVITRPVGYYTYEFTIPLTFDSEEIYYVRWRGLDPTCVERNVIEETFKIVTSSTSTSACCGLIPRFNKC